MKFRCHHFTSETMFATLPQRTHDSFAQKEMNDQRHPKISTSSLSLFLDIFSLIGAINLKI